MWYRVTDRSSSRNQIQVINMYTQLYYKPPHENSLNKVEHKVYLTAPQIGENSQHLWEIPAHLTCNENVDWKMKWFMKDGMFGVETIKVRSEFQNYPTLFPLWNAFHKIEEKPHGSSTMPNIMVLLPMVHGNAEKHITTDAPHVPRRTFIRWTRWTSKPLLDWTGCARFISNLPTVLEVQYSAARPHLTSWFLVYIFSVYMLIDSWWENISSEEAFNKTACVISSKILTWSSQTNKHWGFL